MIFKWLPSFCPNHRLRNVYEWESLAVLIFFSNYRIIKIISPLSFYLLSLSLHLSLSLPLSSLKLTYACQGEGDRCKVQVNSLYWSSNPTPAGAWTHELWNPLSYQWGTTALTNLTLTIPYRSLKYNLIKTLTLK